VGPSRHQGIKKRKGKTGRAGLLACLDRRRLLSTAQGGVGAGGWPAGPDSAGSVRRLKLFFFAIPFSFSVFFFPVLVLGL
jgi:hypothetical protein